MSKKHLPDIVAMLGEFRFEEVVQVHDVLR